MKICQEQLLQINELKLSGKLEKMDNSQFDEFCNAMDVFIETFPEIEAKLKSSFEAKNYTAFTETLTSVKSILVKIYADDLVQDSIKLSSDVQNTKHEKLEAYLTYFTTSMSMLSIDIQMVQHKDEENTSLPESQQSNSIQEDKTEAVKSILAIDDVSFFLNMLRSALENTTYKFIGLTSGDLALKYLLNHTPDLFILDIEMPRMDGYELAKRIRASGQKAPIIFLTGNATRAYVLKAIQTGAADFIVKPVNAEKVIEKIKKHLV